MKKRTLYIIGTGPSLKEMDMDLLKDKDTITFNRDLLKLEKTTDIKFFLSNTTDNDAHDPEDFWEEEWVSDENMFPLSPNITRIIDTIEPSPPGTPVKIEFLDIWVNHNPYKNELRSNVLPNAGIMSMLIGFLMLGYDEIAFIGCDCRYRNDEESNKYLVKKGKAFKSTENYDTNHFRDDYFGENITFGAPNEEEIIYLWGQFSNHIENLRSGLGRDIQVYSCTPGSNANAFYPYISLDNFVKGQRDPERLPSASPGWADVHPGLGVKIHKEHLGIDQPPKREEN